MEFKSNITPNVLSKIGKNLHNQKNHPLEIIKRKIFDYFGDEYKKFDDLNPRVTVKQCFDDLLLPHNHPARSLSDSFYFSETEILRTHTTAHMTDLLTAGHTKFLVAGDVFRKDSVDKFHHFTFHQIDGLCIMDDGQDAEVELKKILSGLIEVLFPGCEYRFNVDFFPFTNNSIEAEVMYNGSWMEILGAGIIHQDILKHCGLEGKTGWAFGCGIERIAIKLFNIPDIRYFHSSDERFINQFSSGDIISFKEYSDFPPITRDLSFWSDDNFTHNDFCEIIREKGGDLVENVSLVDEFTHPKTGKKSKCFRLIFRSNDRTLTNDEINEIQENIKSVSIEKLNVEIR